MLNCFLFEKFYLPYALCDLDSILLHYAKLFIRQSIDREQIFDVTFQNPPLKNPAYATVVKYAEVVKAQLEAESATSAIAEVALRFNFDFETLQKLRCGLKSLKFVALNCTAPPIFFFFG